MMYMPGKTVSRDKITESDNLFQCLASHIAISAVLLQGQVRLLVFCIYVKNVNTFFFP